MYALRIHRLNKKERRQQNNKTKQKKLMKAENNKEKTGALGVAMKGCCPYSFYHASKKDFWGSFSCHRLKKVRLLIFDVKRQTGGPSH
jgi:hypothetical protein